MTQLHYFFPENDLALARDITRYTAPPAAVRLRRAGATLPFFYGSKDGMVLTEGVDAAWLGRLLDTLGITCRPYDHSPEGKIPTPWGWSKASRQVFADIGFAPDALPDDKALDAIRQLSHRRSSAIIADRLASRLDFGIAPAAKELRTLGEIERFVASHPDGSVLKLPWSSSGRGVVATDPVTAKGQSSMFAGMLRRQGSVMAEPRLRKLVDFAMLFTIDGGHCRFDGYSVFSNSQFGSYAGNMLASQQTLRGHVAQYCGIDCLRAIEEALPAVLSDFIGTEYTGPLGVDMMAVEADGYALAPAVELNLRMTMGHLCRIFYERHVVAGASGTFRVIPADGTSPSGFFEASTADGRISHGRIDMAQPGSAFSFVAEID